MVLNASNRCSNEPMGKDLCAGHVSGGECDWELIGEGFIGGNDQIVLDTTRQMLVLLVLRISVAIVFWFRSK